MDTIRFIVIVLIIVIIILTIPIFCEKNVNNSNSPVSQIWIDKGAKLVEPVKTKAIVVARYREDIEWLHLENIKHCNVYIYNKGHPFQKYSNFKYINLPNVGVCDHTYLYHIIHMYDQLEDVTVFLPASCTLKHKSKWKDKVLENFDKYHSFFTNVSTHNHLDSFTIHNYKLSDSRNRDTKNDKLVPCDIRPYGKWYTKNIKNVFNNNMVNYGGIFSLSRDMIRKYPISFYQKLISYMNNDRLPEASHYMERTWYDLFKLDIAFYTVFIGSEKNIANIVNTKPSNIFDCYYFSNNKTTLHKARMRGWIPVYIDIIADDDIFDSNIKAKYFKVLPHRIEELKKYQWTLFIDTKRTCNVDIVLNTCIESNYSFNIVPHTFIKTPPYLEKEIKVSFLEDRYKLQKDRIVKYVDEQRKLYVNEPKTFFGCSIILRKTNDSKSIEICERWRQHIQMCGIKDQISFYFITLMYEQHIGVMRRETFVK